jgi:hypothetical protein
MEVYAEFPREIVISEDYGVAIIGYGQNEQLMTLVQATKLFYDIIESPALIEACRNKVTEQEAVQALTDAGFNPDQFNIYGWADARVVTVTGPYTVVDDSGYQYVMLRDSIDWRY